MRRLFHIPVEVEQELLKLLDIAEAVVFGVPDATIGERPVALLRTTSGRELPATAEAALEGVDRGIQAPPPIPVRRAYSAVLRGEGEPQTIGKRLPRDPRRRPIDLTPSVTRVACGTGSTAGPDTNPLPTAGALNVNEIEKPSSTFWSMSCSSARPARISTSTPTYAMPWGWTHSGSANCGPSANTPSASRSRTRTSIRSTSTRSTRWPSC